MTDVGVCYELGLTVHQSHFLSSLSIHRCGFWSGLVTPLSLRHHAFYSGCERSLDYQILSRAV